MSLSNPALRKAARRALVGLAAVGLLAVPTLGFSQGQGGLTPKQLSDHGWTCFNVPGLGVHCAPPGKWPPTDPSVQLIYFFNTTDPTSDVPDFTGTETLRRADLYKGQPCPTEGQDQYDFLGALGLDYYACHRQTP
jgi:hypothetical protein